MGRMYGSGKGISSSATPYRRKPPSWLKMKPEDVCEHIAKLAKKGLTPSQIGVTLRDSFGVPQVHTVTGNKILRILKTSGLAPELPEDLYCLIKRCFIAGYSSFNASITVAIYPSVPLFTPTDIRSLSVGVLIVTWEWNSNVYWNELRMRIH